MYLIYAPLALTPRKVSHSWLKQSLCHVMFVNILGQSVLRLGVINIRPVFYHGYATRDLVMIRTYLSYILQWLPVYWGGLAYYEVWLF